MIIKKKTKKKNANQRKNGARVNIRGEEGSYGIERDNGFN